MGAGKLVLIGGIGVGLAALLLKSSSSSASTLPLAWRPPAGAKVVVERVPLAGTGIEQMKRTEWHVAGDASGQQPGTFVLTQNAADPNDWVMAFRSDAGGIGIIGYAQTPKAGLLAQAAAAGF